MSIKTQIETTLQCLIGHPFWGAGRIGNLLTFQFGPHYVKTSRHGKSNEVGTYALHVQCARHLAEARRLLVASGDLGYKPIDEDEEMNHYEGEAYRWAKTESSLLDERLLRFFLQYEKTPVLVQALQADDLGGLTIELSASHKLAIFPDDSLDAEYWRLFQTDADPDRPHFVVADQGIEKSRRSES